MHCSVGFQRQVLAVSGDVGKVGSGPRPYLEDPARGDVRERRHWDKYMSAYEAALNATSRPWAPWYAIPADNKSYMRARVAEIIVSALKGIGLKYPKVSDKDRATFAEARKELESGDE